MVQLSPGVEIIERDISLRIPSVTSSVGAIVVAAEKGPLNKNTLITNEQEYIDVFGRPDDVNFKHWFTATSYLKQSNQLYVVRTEDDSTLVSGITVGLSGGSVGSSGTQVAASWPTPKEAEFFPMSYDFIGVGGDTPDDTSLNPDKNEAFDGANAVFDPGEEVFHVYGVGAGTYYDNVSFTVISALDYQQLLNLNEELAQAVTRSEIQDIAQKYYTGTPATTAETDEGDYLSNSLIRFDVIDPDDWSVNTQRLAEYTSFEFGPEVETESDGSNSAISQQDQFALLVYDDLGNLAESYILSKDPDARDTQGNRIFAPDVVNGNSSYIYFFVGNSRTGASGATIISTGKQNLAGADQLTGFRTNTTLADLNGEIETQWREKFTNKETLEIDILLDPDYSDTLKQTLDDICKNIRKDCFAILQVPESNIINTTTGRPVSQQVYTLMKNYVGSSLNINSSYSAIYGQYFQVFDRFAEKLRWVPVTGYVGAVIARVDFTDAQWFAPAGLNRGIIDNIRDVAIAPNKAQRDVLYEARINPIVEFFGEGIVIWGQKTLLSRPSAFDRINVRRLFLHMERSIEKMARFLLFELNDDFTRARFRGQVNPFLSEIQSRRGITDYLVVADESNNTPAVVDRNEFVADIYVKPTRVAEFIRLTFTAVSTGVDFSEVVER